MRYKFPDVHVKNVRKTIIGLLWYAQIGIRNNKRDDDDDGDKRFYSSERTGKLSDILCQCKSLIRKLQTDRTWYLLGHFVV